MGYPTLLQRPLPLLRHRGGVCHIIAVRDDGGAIVSIVPLWILFLTILSALLLGSLPQCRAMSFYDLEAVNIDGYRVKLSAYKGKVTLVVNVASKCGLTDRMYKELVSVRESYARRGFEVLAFPCNQFHDQEPDSNADIKGFARSYNATFPLFAKTTVKRPMCTHDPSANSLLCGPTSEECCAFNNQIYEYLMSISNKPVEWNFAKFLIGRDGGLIKRYQPVEGPRTFTREIERALASADTGDGDGDGDGDEDGDGDGDGDEDEDDMSHGSSDGGSNPTTESFSDEM
ncbi:hypothetical protein CBR_g29495 [Chara braunii]|uniref:Glutathione peroxidase n=1 Tax=Chara braunii TaxID=69332 RepID=A0A388LAJ9_CHABU|nr:hypothetical protein CBR_g29495 [Chara braunii]|eukprot:GBG79345.1 hypothetical protein CBR_g29495 [Chara braunii]